MSEIPDDIKQAGRLEAEFYARWLHAGNSKGSLSPHAIDGLADSFSRLILSEHQREAEMMEEVRKVLGPFGNSDMRHMVEIGHAESEDSLVCGPCDFTYGDLLAAAALLSRLEER